MSEGKRKVLSWIFGVLMVLLLLNVVGAFWFLNEPLNSWVRGEPPTACVVDADCKLDVVACPIAVMSSREEVAVGVDWKGAFCPFTPKLSRGYDARTLEYLFWWERARVATCLENKCVAELYICPQLEPCFENATSITLTPPWNNSYPDEDARRALERENTFTCGKVKPHEYWTENCASMRFPEGME